MRALELLNHLAAIDDVVKITTLGSLMASFSYRPTSQSVYECGAQDDMLTVYSSLQKCWS